MNVLRGNYLRNRYRYNLLQLPAKSVRNVLSKKITAQIAVAPIACNEHN
jgi:hypothetical protein